MPRYKVVEKFVSINGEGPLAGQLAVFIRFRGCNLNCAYCDTAWAKQEDAFFSYMTEHEIYHYVKGTGIKNVTLTGGEPLLDPEIAELLRVLAADRALRVEIETNGSIDLSSYARMDNPPAFTMDYKLPGSRMEPEMQIENFKVLTGKDTVKFVAGSITDLERAKELIDGHQLTGRCHVYLSAVYGEIDPKDIAEYMIRNSMNGTTLQLQLHKVVWDPNQRGV
jgi:7-carboxy-7-deazaguanine synthase